MTEVVANITFSHPAVGRVKRGDSLQVDVSDPAIVKFLQVGYLYLRITGRADSGVVDSGRAVSLLEPGVVLGMQGPPAGEEVTGGEGESADGPQGGGGA